MVLTKNDIRIMAYGTIDELNSFIGQSIRIAQKAGYTQMSNDLLEIQHELFDAGEDLSILKSPQGIRRPYKITSDRTARLRQQTELYKAQCPYVERFILPGGGDLSASLHVCRSVARRARQFVTLYTREDGSNCHREVHRYMAQLPNVLFYMARAANAREGIEDIEYSRGTKVFKE